MVQIAKSIITSETLKKRKKRRNEAKKNRIANSPPPPQQQQHNRGDPTIYNHIMLNNKQFWAVISILHTTVHIIFNFFANGTEENEGNRIHFFDV